MKLAYTRNAARSIIWGIIAKITHLVFAFICRTVLIKTVGAQYLGLEGLCLSLINILNITHLGFGSTIVFCMYKSIADDDNDTLCALLNLCRKIYYTVGSIILIAGLFIMPFLSNFVNGDLPPNVNIYIIFLLFLFSIVLAYWLYGYYTTLFSAFQRYDIYNKRTTFIETAGYILKIIILITCKNFYGYAVIYPLCSIATNILFFYQARKLYPNIIPKGSTNTKTKIEILKKVAGSAANLIYNSMYASVNSVIISTYIGLTCLAIFNTYFAVFGIFIGFIDVFTGSLTAGIGNRMNLETVEQNHTDFKNITFVYSWIVGFCVVLMACLYQHFIYIWVGQEMLFPLKTMLLIVLFFYTARIGMVVYTFRSAAGLWWEDKFRPLAATIANLILSLLLVNKFGVNGVIFSLIICNLFINIPWCTSILYKYFFKKSPLQYFKTLLYYTVVIFTITLLTFYLCNLLHNNSDLLYLFIKIIICVIVSNLLFLLCYYRTPEFNFALRFFIKICKRFYKNTIVKSN